MFFEASKLLDFIINPFYWVIGCFILGLAGKHFSKKWGKWLLVKGVVLLVLFTNPMLVNEVMRKWEIQPYPEDQIPADCKIGVLMGGSMRHYDENSGRPVYSHSADRLLQTLSLYNSGKVNTIVLTGGSGQVFMPHHRESAYIKEVLKKSGVPDSLVIIENNSRNTFENASYTTTVLKQKGIKGKVLLITSAFHMRRSLACFTKAGLHPVPFPVDPRSVPFTWQPSRTFMPDAYAFVLWNQLIHEWIGMIVYKTAGYI